MNIRTEIREIEAHIKTIAGSKEEQIKIISEAQSMANGDETLIAVLAIAKNRIIRGA